MAPLWSDWVTGMPFETVRAARAHEIPERPPLRVAVADSVEIVQRDDEWPAFVFVKARHGSGWVPARHLSSDAGAARVLAAYDTTELPTRAGEQLEVLERDDESGWLWCRASDGREGWVPVKTVEPG